MSEEEFLKEAKEKAIEHIKEKGIDDIGFDHNNIHFKKAIDIALRTQQQKVKEASDKREHTHQINLECAREGARKSILDKVKEVIDECPAVGNIKIRSFNNLTEKEYLKKELGLE